MHFAPALEEMARVTAGLSVRGRACDIGPSLCTWGGPREPGPRPALQQSTPHSSKQKTAEWNQE